MNKKNIKWLKIISLGVLPFVYGCGAGGATALGSLFAGGLASSLGLGGGGPLSLLSTGGGEAIATFHNPEPTTMLLMGSGMMAMAYFKNRTK